jgi:membrane-bound lytic murein transglycosylase A
MNTATRPGLSTWALAVLAAVLLSACGRWAPAPGPGAAIDWADLPGWAADRHLDAWPALEATCRRDRHLGPPWPAICAAARDHPPATDAAARAFFERWFEPRPMRAGWFDRDGLVTGYYEPVLSGSLDRGGRYRYPVYAPPDDLVRVELGELYPELEGKRVRGRLVGNRVVPYHPRSAIDGEAGPLDGHELLWVDDPVELFFLHIQGSGRVRLTDGRIVGVGYADQNGHPYRAIGRELIQRGELEREEVNLFSIRDWLRGHPGAAEEVMNSNPSYVFFVLRDRVEEGPVGSLNVPLTAGRSIAVDRTHIPLGIPVWLETTRPDDGRPLRRLTFAQDTGGAIRGQVRADLFFGTGDEAERMAGLMKQKGRLYLLMPKSEGDG